MEHLTNMKPIEAMGEIEKIRVQELRTKKLRDDKLNRVKEIEKYEMRKKEVRDLREYTNTVVPFDEKQFREKELNKKARESELKRVEIMQHRAAYIDGMCAINNLKLEDFEKWDDQKAKREQEERNKAYDAIK